LSVLITTAGEVAQAACAAAGAEQGPAAPACASSIAGGASSGGGGSGDEAAKQELQLLLRMGHSGAELMQVCDCTFAKIEAVPMGSDGSSGVGGEGRRRLVRGGTGGKQLLEPAREAAAMLQQY
jgi:hypothetical protein